MAITFHQIPKSYSPSDNPLVYVYSSNQTAQANFSYVVETYFNGVVVSTDRTFVENGIKSSINISDKVLQLLPTPTRPTTIAEAVTTGLIKIKVHESYGVTPVLMANATISETKIWKACISNEQFIDVDFEADYKLTKYFCDKLDKSFTTYLGQDVFLSMLCGTSLTSLEIETYDEGGVYQNTYSIDFTIDICKLNFNSTILTANGVDMTDVRKVTFKVGSSEVWTVYYEATAPSQSCNDVNSLVWMNDYGMFEQFNFEYKHELNAVTSSAGYSKVFGGYVAGVYTFNTDNGDRNYRVITNRKGKIFSKWLTEVVQNWLVTCLESPRHFLNGMPIKVTTAIYKKEQDEHEELISLEVGYDFTQQKKSITL